MANKAAEASPVQATARLRSEHRRETGRLQLALDRLTALTASPRFAPAIAALSALWVAGNLAAPAFGLRSFDPPPFAWLQGAMSACSLYIAALLVSTQRREAQLADHRDHLILEMAILTEQKSAKAIQLLEEYRRDNPLVANRRDDEAQGMAEAADHAAILNSIKLTE